MTEEEIKIQCIRLAIENNREFAGTSFILSDANNFYEWIKKDLVNNNLLIEGCGRNSSPESL